MDTLSKVRFLYGQLNVDATEEQQTIYENWLKFIVNNEEKINRFYADDGNPAVFVTRGSTGVPICGYRWLPPDVELKEEERQRSGQLHLPSGWYASKDWTAYDSSKLRGVMFFLHGITESCRFSLLNLKTLESVVPVSRLRRLNDHQKAAIEKLTQCDNCCIQSFAGGWAEALVKAGYAVYGVDMQGHGLSQSWRNSRCNAEHFSNYIDDTYLVIKTFHSCQEWVPSTPLFISGLSMGGCIATRLCQMAFSRGDFQTLSDDKDLTHPRIAGLILFCPALSAERLKSKLLNRIMMSFGNLVSNLFPTAEVALLASPEKYLWLREVITKDPLIHTNRLPARISYETILTMDDIFPEAHLLPSNLRVCLIQSKEDTMTDPEGSDAFMKMISCKETAVHWLDYGWHFLSKEPGHAHTINLALNFMNSVTSKQDYTETSGSDAVLSNDANR